MTVSIVDIGAILPEMVLVSYACAILVIETFIPKAHRDILAYASLAGLGLAAYATLRVLWVEVPVFSGLYILDPYSNFFKILLYIAAAMTILLSLKKRIQEQNILRQIQANEPQTV